METIILNWYLSAIKRGLPGLNVNTTAPMLGLAVYWSKTKDARFSKVLNDWADQVVAEAARTEYRSFQHDVSDKTNRGELWADTLFMVCLFLAIYGQASGRRELVDEAEVQFLTHAKFLADPESGLWFHGWTFAGRHNFAKAKWARGNAWITAGLVDLFELAVISPSVKQYLSGVLQDQVSALLPLQRPSGSWTTLLDDPESYEETSATAGFAYGLMKGARCGLGGHDWLKAGVKALSAVMKSIDENGVVQGVSYGTRMGHDLQHYLDISIQPTAYGQSLAILALVESQNHIGVN